MAMAWPPEYDARSRRALPGYDFHGHCLPYVARHVHEFAAGLITMKILDTIVIAMTTGYFVSF